MLINRFLNFCVLPHKGLMGIHVFFPPPPVCFAHLLKYLSYQASTPALHDIEMVDHATRNPYLSPFFQY